MKRALTSVGRFLAAHWAILALLGLAIGLHWDLLVSAVPATGDHMIHMYKGWLMAEHLLPSGRVAGWSHMAFAGYPAGVYYPILGDLLVALTRWITLGLLTWERTYAVMFFALVLWIPVVPYLIARRFTGRAGALLAGVMCAVDVGGWPQGGHISTVHWAVWPFILSLTLSMLALLICDAAVLRPIRERPGRFLAFVTVLALAALAHPMSAFFLGLSAPIYVLFLAVAERRRSGPCNVIGRSAAAAALALLLVSFWIVPWITTGDRWTLGWPAVGFGGMWLSLPKMLEALAKNKLFYSFNLITWISGGVGIALAIVSRRRWPLWVATMLVLLFAFAGLANAIGDGLLARKVQVERIAAFMKLLWFVLAGLTFDRLGAGLAWLLKKPFERLHAAARKWLSRLAEPVLGVGLAAVFLAVSWSGHVESVLKIGYLGGDIWQDIVRAERWLAEQPRGPLDRVLYQPGKLCVRGNLRSPKCNEVYHRHIFASGPVRTNLPKLKFGYEATAIFRNVPLEHRWPQDASLIQELLTRPEAMESLHVRWIVSLAEWPPRTDIEEVRRFGNVIVYQVAPGREPPVRIRGPGEIEVERFEDERITVRVSGAGPESRLLFPVAFFYPWVAYDDGREVPLKRHGVLPHVRQILMAVDASDGVVELRYERPWWERLAGWTSALGWLAAAAAGLWLIIVRLRRRRTG